ncbi:unnamed protein product [Clonostachys rosea]|uniref:ferric-chelate reductase (NADPH) n=1 Tax=Bionectria ochroleuca TaxID=29856 RepID=A0ABY6TN51_BIOOC|nr:unnamed protein product [Clonostachys rosea]
MATETMAAELSARAGPGAKDPAIEAAARALNNAYSNYLFIMCGAIGGAILLWKLMDSIIKYTRHIVCLNNDRQRYFAIASPWNASIKRHILYAPLFRKRHNREIQLSSAINVGTLPSRFQFVFLVAYFATNIAFCLVGVPFNETASEALDVLRKRSGWLSTLNMIPLFVFAGRNNPLIPLLNISFDTYNLLHRWFGRIVVIEAVIHTIAHVAKTNWAWNMVFAKPFYAWGSIATIAFLVLLVQSWSPIRHAFYETFKILHILAAAASIVGLYMHLASGARDGFLSYCWIVIALWVADRGARILRIVYINIGRSRSRTVIEALPGNAIRVTMTLARPFRGRPGQHGYLYMPGVSLWQSHPFSISWFESTDDVSSDKLVSNHQERRAMQKMQIGFIIRARTGYTDNLYKRVAASPAGKMETTCFFEGPYGVKHPLDSYGTVVLFAGGVGVTHQVPYVKDLVAGYANGTVATRRILLVWTIQSPEHLEWIRPWMTEVLGMDKRRDVLRIMLFVSKPRSIKEIHSPSSTVQMFPGRPNIDTLMQMEQEQQVGAMAVTVCGPGTLSDEVRRVVRDRQHQTSIDFVEEAFSW